MCLRDFSLSEELDGARRMQWWKFSSDQLQGVAKKGINFLIILWFGYFGIIEMIVFLAVLS
jgi:hypothetical protein